MWDYFAQSNSGFMFEGNVPPNLYDPITQTSHTMATFSSVYYNGEFEGLFPDLTINRDVVSKEIGDKLDFTMTSIFVALI